MPTAHYGANSAWQQLSVLAHNLARSFQLDTLATPKPRSRKRTYAYLIRSNADFALSAHRPRWSADPHRGSSRPALGSKPAHRNSVWVHHSTLGCLSYFRISARGSAAVALLVARRPGRMASPRPPRKVEAEGEVSGGEHARRLPLQGRVIETQSYKSDGDRWRPKALVSVFQGGSVRVHQVPALDATHDTEEDANAYAIAMAKKWIDDRG